MIITSSRGPKGATQTPVLRSCQLKEFGAKSNQLLITLNLTKRIETALFPERGGVVRDLNLTKRIESFTVHVTRFKHLEISQRGLKGFFTCSRVITVQWGNWTNEVLDY